MKKLLFFSLSLFSTILYATQINTDSLKILLPQKDGFEKLEILQSLNREYLFSSADSCIKYGEKAVLLAHKLHDNEQEALAYKRMGYTSYILGNFRESIQYYNRSLINFNASGEYLDAAIITNLLGDAYSRLSDFSNAISYFKITERNCDTLINNPSVQTSVKRLSSVLYINLGLLYYKIDSTQKPLDYFNKALIFAQEIGDSTRIAACFSNIGMVYKKNQHYDLALSEYFKSLKISIRHGNNNYQTATLTNIATLYEKKSINDTALLYYLKANKLAFDNKNKFGLSHTFRGIASIYSKKGNFHQAITNANLALKNAQATNSLKEISFAYKLLSDIYIANGNFKDALNYYIEYSLLEDSISGAETKQKVIEIEMKYETEKKEKENKLLKKDIEIQKRKSNYLLLLAAILSLMGMISLALFYYLRKNALTKKQLAESEAARLEIELDSQKRELTLGALSLSRNIEFINSLIKELKSVSSCVSEEGIPQLNRIVKKLNQQQSDSSWKEFEMRFSEIHSGFYNRLLEKYPSLTQSEVKLAAFLKLGMTTKEICSITFQSIRAVETARLRLRKKLNLESGNNLSMFLQKL